MLSSLAGGREFLIYGMRNMSDFEVRPLQPLDVEPLTTLWLRIMLERAEMDRRFQLSENAQAIWRESLETWLEQDNVRILVADHQGRLIGYVFGWLLERPVNLLQQRYGFISDLGVDGHAHIGGVGTALFKAIQPWFREHDIETLEVQVMHQHPIAQAFWRANGAAPYVDRLWYRLSD